MTLRLNLGSGSVRIPGFVNVDLCADEDVDVVADVRELPFMDSTVAEIYASHILEHIDYDYPVLEEWARVLVPGGLITVSVPDPIATYYAWKHESARWGPPENSHPVDLQYVNACCFGGFVLGGEWDTPGQYHRQVFFFDMLVERMRPLFPDAHQVAGYVLGAARLGLPETVALGTWVCETTVQGHNGKRHWTRRKWRRKEDENGSP